MNSAVENRNQEVDLRSKVARLKRESGLNIYDLGKQTSKPGDFFVEQSMRIQFNGKEDQIVNFLMRLGGDEDSLMRISRFSVSPDGQSNPTKLRGLATVTSYQKDYIAPPPEETGKAQLSQAAPPSRRRNRLNQPSRPPNRPWWPRRKPKPSPRQSRKPIRQRPSGASRDAFAHHNETKL